MNDGRVLSYPQPFIPPWNIFRIFRHSRRLFWKEHGSVLEVAPACPNLSCFPLFLPSSFQQEAFGCDCYCNVLSCFWAVAATTFFQRVSDTSHTPRIISSLVEILQNGIQHGYFLEVAPACPNLSCFPLFLPSSFQQEAFGCDCFFMFCPVSGLVGWLWQLNFIRRVPDISHTPRIISSLVEIPQNGIQHGSFLKTMGWVTSQN